MPRTNLVPSPCAEILLTPYGEVAFPKFGELFQAFSSSSSPLRHLARDPEEAAAAIVLENRSQQAVTGLRYRWGMTDESGKQSTSNASSDSYMVDVYRAVAEPGSRHLISPAGSVDAALIDHVRAGGGLISAGGSKPALSRVVELTFEIEFVLFEDGEIAGPDPDRGRKAGEFAVRRVRRRRDDDAACSFSPTTPSIHCYTYESPPPLTAPRPRSASLSYRGPIQCQCPRMRFRFCACCSSPTRRCPSADRRIRMVSKP